MLSRLIKRLTQKLFRINQEDIDLVEVIEKAVDDGLRIENTCSGGFLISREPKQ